MKINGFRCDVCRAQKLEVNRWFLMWFGPELILSRWQDSEADRADFHLCGQQCVIAKINEFLQGGGA